MEPPELSATPSRLRNGVFAAEKTSVEVAEKRSASSIWNTLCLPKSKLEIPTMAVIPSAEMSTSTVGGGQAEVQVMVLVAKISKSDIDSTGLVSVRVTIRKTPNAGGETNGSSVTHPAITVFPLSLIHI